MNYDTLIDDETWAFIRETETYYPADTITADIATQRAIYDRMCRAFFTGYPDGVSARDDMAGSVPIRIYEGTRHDATVIYYHGGGFVVGGLDSHDDVCAEICERSGVRVVSADYRLCPEHKHPAAYDDALEVAQYVALTWPSSLILAGDSAGGNLAAAVAHSTRGDSRYTGQVLIYPGLGGDMSKGSYLSHAHAPMLTLDDILFYQAMRYQDEVPGCDPTSAPLQATSFADLPPTLIVTAECDPLADDGQHYRDAILAARGRVRWVNEPGLVHGYLRARYSVTRARLSFDRIVAAIGMFARGEWYD
ncbi:alpha/beta hydrolase [Aliiroseovarius sp. 2305UL8-7]|uniref:alpha/beta hydrolase n=1 Tax=Aliiroseovarius conchicola TaxID=3121637 RepID=UPI003528B62F